MLTSFLLCMVRNPAVFKRAQEEIDAVIGHDRLPDLEDRASLPYLDCVIKELYRFVSFHASRVRFLRLTPVMAAGLLLPLSVCAFRVGGRDTCVSFTVSMQVFLMRR